MDDGPKAFPSHGPGPVQHPRRVVQQSSIPVIFQDAPTAFDRVVFAVIRRIVNQHESPVRDAIELATILLTADRFSERFGNLGY